MANEKKTRARFLENLLKWLIIGFFFAGLVITATAVLAPYIGLGRGIQFIVFDRFGLPRRAFALGGLRICLSAFLLSIPFYFRKSIWEFFYSRLTSRRFLFKCVLVFGSTLISLFVFLTAYDRYLLHTGESVLPGLDLVAPETTIRALELYPYTGWHAQTNFSHRGPMHWEKYPNQDYDVKTGPLGFFIDFDLENPPPKKAGEYRIILIGGSGAQGWGGLSNEKMLYRQLEGRLNELVSESGRVVKVINLAMQSTITYQNFIALNRWGHQLDPDLILSYSGRNDWVVPMTHEYLPDTHYAFTALNTLVYASRGSEYGPKLRWLSDLFPNVMNRTNVGISLKLLVDSDYLQARAYEGYKKNRGVRSSDPRTMFEKEVIPFYMHALKSIKRDFQGVPIMLAWQTMAPHELSEARETLGDDFYNKMFERTKAEVGGYINTQWYFLNVHRHFENDSRPYIATHLTDEGHVIVADMIAKHIADRVLGSPVE